MIPLAAPSWSGYRGFHIERNTLWEETSLLCALPYPELHLLAAAMTQLRSDPANPAQSVTTNILRPGGEEVGTASQ